MEQKTEQEKVSVENQGFHTKESNERFKNDFVLVTCSGITVRTGFYAYPEESSPVYVEFFPNRPALVEKNAAAFLVAQDKTRFEIVKEPVTVVEAPKAAEPSTATAEDTKAVVAEGGQKNGKNNRKKRQN